MLKQKICLLGSFGVGKTSLVARFVLSLFSDKYHTTVGVKIDKKTVDLSGRIVNLNGESMSISVEAFDPRVCGATGCKI